eukprot:CAMPEP_0202490406 /NCGR_PEP_ID=MMETSP1361-20130828/7816_1 /ASSEMBLY_ACC=CAM_ASM_000849 /TAXON_ID=210615 /ORGANISM="Staurosira complex sp., Strain CCMP2646" /LENGTH=320 /DNA_ID=CAMNT_0049120285 /DNA_START=119 /DNA_END=1081 /DNA_ORIENTATION=-
MKFHFSVLTATVLLASCVNGFAPSSSFTPSSTTLQRTAAMSPEVTAFRQQQGFGPMHSSSPQTSHTALQMNLVNRFLKVAQSNVLKVIQSLESPEKIMNQAMIDMQDDIVKVRQSYAELTASTKRLSKQKDSAEAQAKDWYRRAQLALQAGNDSLAKEALARRQQQLENMANLQTQIDTQNIAADKLFEGIRTLEGKILEAKTRKNEFIARAKAAESQTKVNDMLSGLTGNTSMDAFKRMEEKVEALEAAAEASNEMLKLLPENSSDSLMDNVIENEFLLLEGNSAVEEEFERMKMKMLGASSPVSETTITKIPISRSEF